jgi:hypothetical protein
MNLLKFLWGAKKVLLLLQRVSISPTFHDQLFCMKVILDVFLYLRLGFFGARKLSEKRLLLVKLTTVLGAV